MEAVSNFLIDKLILSTFQVRKERLIINYSIQFLPFKTTGLRVSPRQFFNNLLITCLEFQKFTFQ